MLVSLLGSFSHPTLKETLYACSPKVPNHEILCAHHLSINGKSYFSQAPKSNVTYLEYLGASRTWPSTCTVWSADFTFSLSMSPHTGCVVAGVMTIPFGIW